MNNPATETIVLYGLKWSKWSAAISRRFDVIIALILVLAVTGAFHIHYMLLAGDWDFWVDWKDRQWWVTVTPIMAITFPAALQYIFWEKFKLPIGATFAILCLMLGEWMNRYFGFHLWSHFPISMVFPSMLIPSALVLDAVLLLSGNFLVTALIGGGSFALLFYPSNWTMMAAYRLPVEFMGTLMSVGDVIGYTFTRTATPEYLRMVERGTLRTFGGHSAWVASAFAGFVCMIMYVAWWYLGKYLCRIPLTPNKFKHMMGLPKDKIPTVEPSMHQL